MRLIKLLKNVANPDVCGYPGDVRECVEPTAGMLVDLGAAIYLDDDQGAEPEPDDGLDYQYTSPKFLSFAEQVDQFSRDYNKNKIADALEEVQEPEVEALTHNLEQPTTTRGVSVKLNLSVNLNGSPFANCKQYQWGQ